MISLFGRCFLVHDLNRLKKGGHDMEIMKNQKKWMFWLLLNLIMSIGILFGQCITAKATDVVATVTNSSGETTEYDDINNAIANWVDGSTLKLMADISSGNSGGTKLNSYLRIAEKSVILDLNDHRLHGDFIANPYSTIYVESSGSLVIKDTAENKTTRYWENPGYIWENPKTAEEGGSGEYTTEGGYINGSMICCYILSLMMIAN